MNIVQTTCGYCGCGCGIQYTTTQDNEIATATPQAHHPVNKGKLCAKGWAGHDFVHHPKRLTTPLLRDEAGKFSSISWEKAFSIVAEKFSSIKNTYGSKSIATLSSARCTNEENYLLARLTRAVFGSPHIDHCARL